MRANRLFGPLTRFGVVVAFIACAIDQASKLYLLKVVDLEAHGPIRLGPFFDFVLTREDYGASKPDPEPYRTACARAGLRPGRCLAIEDSERGVVAAARAGLVVAALPGEMNRGGDFGAARWLLDRIQALPALLGLD